MISDYLESLVDALNFDRSLSRRVQEEVEDHLREAVGAEPRCDGPEAERRATANFGDPYAIAAQFAVVSLAKRTRSLGNAVILVIAGIFITMKARVAWYAVMQCAIGDDIRRDRELDRPLRILAFDHHRDRGLGVHLRPSYSRGVPCRIS